jgi:hypothetical protein
LKVVFGVTSGADEVSEHEECSSVFASDLVGTRMIEKDLRGSTAKLGYNVGDRALTAHPISLAPSWVYLSGAWTKRALYLPALLLEKPVRFSFPLSDLTFGVEGNRTSN